MVSGAGRSPRAFVTRRLPLVKRQETAAARAMFTKVTPDPAGGRTVRPGGSVRSAVADWSAGRARSGRSVVVPYCLCGLSMWIVYVDQDYQNRTRRLPGPRLWLDLRAQAYRR